MNTEREFVEKKLENGQTLIIPVFSEKDVTIGMRRKTRHLKEEEAQEEIFWILLESTLTDEQLEVWDTLTAEEFQAAFDTDEDNELKK